jgi:hypothetical protein
LKNVLEKFRTFFLAALSRPLPGAVRKAKVTAFAFSEEKLNEYPNLDTVAG